MIRKANQTDPLVLDRLARRVADDLHASGIDQWSAIYPGIANFQTDLATNGLYVYEKDNVVLGSVTVKFVSDDVYREVSWNHTHPAVIHRLMVDPDHRREGIGIELMKYVLDLVRNSGFDSVRVDTHPDNFRMKAFLTRFGFEPRGYLPSINRDAYEWSARE